MLHSFHVSNANILNCQFCFQLEFRQENLDLIAERLFGPKGYFSTHDLHEVIKTGKEKWTDLENTVKQRLNHAIRGKRSVTKEALEEVRQKVRAK
jgi:hypothetical protein